MEGQRVDSGFFQQDVLSVAPGLIGKNIVRAFPDGSLGRFIITETEAYRGEEDKACHASKGKTPRTQVMFRQGGAVYMYLIYGIHWMLNIVAAPAGVPQAVLIRSVDAAKGPGRVTRMLQLDGDFYGEDLMSSKRIWIEENRQNTNIITGPRVGIDYAGEYWKNKPWRFQMKDQLV